MAEQFYTILTAVGKAKIANAAALGEKVELAHLALGDGGGSYYNPTEDQTELRNEVWRGAIGTVDVDTENPNWIIIQTVVPSQHGGFMIREAGVFDDEGDLIAVGKYPETYKPVAADGSIKDLVIRMILEVSNAASVVLKVDPTVVLATQQQVNEAEARAKAYTDQEVAEVSQALDTHLADNTPHREAVSIERKNPDDDGIFKLIEFRRPDGTLFKTSQLDGTSPYNSRTVKYYDKNENLMQTVEYSITYSDDGEVISEVIISAE